MISMWKHLIKVFVCLMYPHRHAVGAVLLTIFASKGEQMYRSNELCLPGYSNFGDHPKAFLSDHWHLFDARNIGGCL